MSQTPGESRRLLYGDLPEEIRGHLAEQIEKLIAEGLAADSKACQHGAFLQ
jgi:hypothetical protein